MKNKIIGLFFSFLMMTTLAATVPSAAYTLDDATNMYNLGIDYYSQNQVQKSIDCFKQAISIDPKFYEAYYNLGQIQASYGYLDAAIKTYEKITELKPQDYESVYELGNLLYKKGYLNRSLSYLAKIPASSSEFYTKAASLESKIKKRQAELAFEAKQKEQKEDMKKELQEKMTMQKTDPQQSLGVQTPPRPAVIEQSNIITQIQAPSGIVVDSQGNIYAASFSENVVYRISPDGEKSVYVEASHLGGPIGLAIDENDYLYVANYARNNVIRVTPSGVISEFAQVRKPYCINVDNHKKSLVVTEQETNSVLRYAL